MMLGYEPTALASQVSSIDQGSRPKTFVPHVNMAPQCDCYKKVNNI